MGDMADFALDCSMDEDEHYERYRDAPLSVQYEEGIVDEHGALIGFPGCRLVSSPRRLSKKPSGEGACPLCGGGTREITGVNGVFYGCLNYPKCKGSRNSCEVDMETRADKLKLLETKKTTQKVRADIIAFLGRIDHNFNISKLEETYNALSQAVILIDEILKEEEQSHENT